MTSRIRLIVADDYPVVLAGLQGMLASQLDFEIVGEASDGLAAVTLTTRLQPGVVLMDLRMPQLDGVEATRQIKAQCPATQVLVLTTYDSDTDILGAIEVGATGYLLKDAPREALFDAVRTVARGETVFAPPIADRIEAHQHIPLGNTLSIREIEVLTLAVRGARNKDIARQLFISEATVKSHFIHIFEKLHVSDRTAAVTVALERRILTL